MTVEKLHEAGVGVVRTVPVLDVVVPVHNEILQLRATVERVREHLLHQPWTFRTG
jgi:hypothetical protein